MDEPNACDFCGETFGLDIDLKRHFLTHISETHLVIEPKQETSSDDFLKTDADIKPDVKIELDLCVAEQSIKEIPSLEFSITLNTDLKNENLDKEESSDRTNVKVEPNDVKKLPKLKRSVQQNAVYSCDQCEQSVSSKRALNNRVRGHSDPAYTCVQCGTFFTAKKCLMRHLRLRGHDTPVVEKAFKKQMKGHAESKTFECIICKKCFQQKSQLNQHIVIHGDKNYSCEYCGKAFVNMSNLKKHIATHPAERIHQCDVCDKSFSDVMRLKEHISTHTGCKPFPCNLCTKSFTRKYILTEHKLTHSEKTPFKCAKCDEKFATKQTLNNHVKLAHEQSRAYKCNFCGKLFVNKRDLTSHILSMHTGKRSV